MVKSHEKKNLFSYDGVVKCRRNLNFEKGMDTEKMMGFDEQYLTSTSNKILLR